MAEGNYDAAADAVRQTTTPALLPQFHAGVGNYMMPQELLPMMDCDKCMYRLAGWRDGGHCYMFRTKPAGDRCGQMKKILEKVSDR